jgi:hypothetical protein
VRPSDEWAARQLAVDDFKNDMAARRERGIQRRAEWAKAHIPILGWLWYRFMGFK